MAKSNAPSYDDLVKKVASKPDAVIPSPSDLSPTGPDFLDLSQAFPPGVTVIPPADSVDSMQSQIEERKRLYRRKPLLVEAYPNPNIDLNSGEESWIVLEAGREVSVPKDEFLLLYELVDISPDQTVDAGLPDLNPGTVIEKDNRRLIRVEVVSGKGAGAYWYMNKPDGTMCQFKVVADNVIDPLASHFAGRFIEPWEGGGSVTVKRTWVILPK
jgi:hypothetical protein